MVKEMSEEGGEQVRIRVAQVLVEGGYKRKAQQILRLRDPHIHEMLTPLPSSPSSSPPDHFHWSTSTPSHSPALPHSSLLSAYRSSHKRAWPYPTGGTWTLTCAVQERTLRERVED